MQLTVWKKKAQAWLVDFLVVQLFINLISWPIFLCWGLSITPLSMLGNVIFSPFLTGFLLLSSLIVTCEFFSLPNDYLLFALEKLSNIWLWLTSCNSYDCGVTFAKPSLIFTLTAPLCGFFVLHFHPLKNNNQKLLGLCATYVVCIIVFSLKSSPIELKIPYGSNYVTVINKDKQMTLTDPGFMRRYSSINSWINYTLLPELAKNFGSQTIDKLILTKETPSALACAELLQKKGIAREISIKKINSIKYEHVKAMPSFHAVSSSLSKNP